VNATDVSVAHPTDALPSVCRTYMCHVSRPFEVHRVSRPLRLTRTSHFGQRLSRSTDATQRACLLKTAMDASPVCRQTRSRNAFRVLDRQTRPVTHRRTRLSHYAAPRLNRPSDRRGNSGQPSVCRSTTTASDGSPSPGPKPRARVWR
jgi:hypothetical protein